MRTLLAFEFKKLLGRKALWFALALGFALWAIVNWSTLSDYGLSGYAGGMKDVYRQYEGQVLTRALQAQIQRDYDDYIAAHPDSFVQSSITDDAGNVQTTYVPLLHGSGYVDGLWQAYNDLTQGGTTLEDEQDFVRYAQERLAAGVDEQGNPLTYSYRRNLEKTVQIGVVEPVVHYTKGWAAFFQNEPMAGMAVLAVTAMALLGLFNGEVSARTEAIFLSACARRRAVWAKLLVAVLAGAGSAILFFGLQLAVMAFSWGLDGARLPVGTLGLVYDYAALPIVVAFALSSLALVLAAVACGVVVAWASAQFRHALLTLLVGGAILVGMVALWHNDSVLLAYWHDTPLAGAVNQVLYALPANTLTSTYFLPERVADTGTLALLLLLPVGFTTLLGWLAHRAFLRRRKG